MSDEPGSEPVTTPSGRETVPVQLTRMEGVLNLLAFQFNDVAKRVEKHDVEIAEHGMAIQRLDLDAKSSAATALALAQALREADEARGRKAAEAWSPFQKFLAVLGSTLAIAGLVIAYIK